MDTLKGTVLAVCLLSTAVGLAGMTVPPGSLDRQIRFFLELLFILSLSAPLMHLTFPPSLDSLTESRQSAQETAVSDAIRQQILAETKPRTEAALTALLEDNAIGCTSLEADMYIDGDGCIYCSEVRAQCSDFSAACRVLEEALGEGVSICVTEVLP